MFSISFFNTFIAANIMVCYHPRNGTKKLKINLDFLTAHPQGWVVPSDNDWAVLEQEIITNWKKYSIAGTPQPNLWDASWCTLNTPDAYHGSHGIIFKSYTPVTVTPDGAGSNHCKAGFNALLAGRLAEGGTTYYGTRAYFWTSTRSDSFFRWYRSFGNNNDGIKRARVNDSQYYMSVRCKKKD